MIKLIHMFTIKLALVIVPTFSHNGKNNHVKSKK